MQIPVSPTYAKDGLIVSPYWVASEVGQAILQTGGNAVDAAIATNAALCVTYPHMNGLGGDALWLIYEAQSQKIYGLNGSGRSAKAATLERFQGQDSLPQRGPLAALTVPGTVESWWQAHQRFGQLPWKTLLQPAIHLAAQGYPVSFSQVRWTQQDQALLAADAGAANTFLPGGTVPKVGATLQNPDLAGVLVAIATQGVESFYRGDLTTQLVTWLTAQGGLLSLEDFATYQSDWVEPISTVYREHPIYELPPNTQGLTVLQILNLIEPFDLQKIGHGTADYYHLLVEATKLAFCDRDRWVTDPRFLEIPVANLISKAYAHRRSARISLSGNLPYPATPLGGDTTYSAVVDAQGNAVSLIQSLYFDYGAGIAPPGLGFMLNNRGSLFALDPYHPNCLAACKRSFHTLIPAMSLTPDGELDMVFGTMGGEGQPQTQVALLTRVLDFGFDIQTAVNLPRWRWGRNWGANSTELTLEGRIPLAVRQELQRRGHQVRTTSNWSEAMGHAHMIRLTQNGLAGACDPRSDGFRGTGVEL